MIYDLQEVYNRYYDLRKDCSFILKELVSLFSKVAFSIFGLPVYKYAVCIVFGIALSLILMRLSNNKFGIDYEDVIKYLKLIPEDHDIQLYSFLAEAYYNTGETEKAEECARLQLAKQPENNRAKFILGSIKLDAGDNEQAYRYLYEIYQTDSNYPGLGDKLAKASVKFWPQVVFYSVMIL